MSLATLAELKAGIAAWLYNRTDLEGAIGSFIALAEAELDGRVRHRMRRRRTGLSLAGEVTELPEDLRGLTAVTLSGRTLDLTTPEAMARARGAAPEGPPRLWSLTADGLEIWPAPTAGSVAQISWTAAIPALSDAAPSNWLLARHPGVYLYGALTQAAPYLAEDERAGTWGRLFAAAVEAVNASGRDETAGGLTVRPGLPVI